MDEASPQNNFIQSESDSHGAITVRGLHRDSKLEHECPEDAALKYLAQVLVAEHLYQKNYGKSK